MSDYYVKPRSDMIDDLCMWIGEATGSDLYLMKIDLTYLTGLSDEYLFSSYSTNEYVLWEDEPEEFNVICRGILKLNEELKNE